MTNRMDEAQLIAEFRENRSEDAFASLVRRHVDFVYATALRQLGDSGLAEEITQDVFEGRGFREVGEALGLGEDAARKRVNRALERLTEFFRQHGFAVPTITAGTALFVGVSAPASLVGSIASSGLAAIPTAATLGVLMTPTIVKAGLATV